MYNNYRNGNGNGNGGYGNGGQQSQPQGQFASKQASSGAPAPRANRGDAKESPFIQLTGLFKKENQYGVYFSGTDGDGFSWIMVPNREAGPGKPDYYLRRSREANSEPRRQGGYGGQNPGGGYQGTQSSQGPGRSAADNG